VDLKAHNQVWTSPEDSRTDNPNGALQCLNLASKSLPLVRAIAPQMSSPKRGGKPSRKPKVNGWVARKIHRKFRWNSYMIHWPHYPIWIVSTYYYSGQWTWTSSPRQHSWWFLLKLKHAAWVCMKMGYS
jgi:hypothetical protein